MEKEKIMQTINDLQSQYENVHIHMEGKCCTFDIWGSTNNTNKHGVVMDERDFIFLDGIVPSSVKVKPSVYWEDGVFMSFSHEDGSKTILDFFN